MAAPGGAVDKGWPARVFPWRIAGLKGIGRTGAGLFLFLERHKMAGPCPGSKNGAHTWDIDPRRHGRCTNHGCSAEADFSSFIDMHRDHLRKEDLRVINDWREQKKAEKEGKKVPGSTGDMNGVQRQGSAAGNGSVLVPVGPLSGVVTILPPAPPAPQEAGTLEQAKRNYRSKKYYDSNRKAIEEDIRNIGTMKALAKWNIASGTFTGIRRRWGKADAAAARKVSRRANAPQLVHLCPSCGKELNQIKMNVMKVITGEQSGFFCSFCQQIFEIRVTGIVVLGE